MQKKMAMFVLLLILIIGLAACNGNAETDDNDNMDDPEEMPVLEVDLQVNDSAEPGETVEMLAEVTYGDETVTDADEVDYEVWEKGERDDGYFIEAENLGDGTYTAETSFDEDGIYHVQVHVTARDMHTMPQQEVTVGEGGDYSHVDEDEEDDHWLDHEDMHPDDEEDDHTDD
ncbi:FixH family protein [Virgibacillus kimchii]